jgi:hypothetical protein
LKTDKPQRRPDGRLESRLSWEYRFKQPVAKVMKLQAYWHEFEPTYRGKPVPREEVPAFDPTKLEEFGVSLPGTSMILLRCEQIMCRSFFATQEGDFELILGSVETVEGSPSWLDWLSSWFRWFF